LNKQTWKFLEYGFPATKASAEAIPLKPLSTIDPKKEERQYIYTELALTDRVR
jgi:hypothetical protein